ncbi:MAG: bacteriohemerythrin [Candidatus Woesearchaeota archaeon]
MLIQWDESFDVGNDELNKQHKVLVDKVNEMHDSIKAGVGKEKIIEMVNFLDDYAKMHFKYEEEYFSKNNFPEKTQHCEMHQKFIEAVANAKQKVASGQVDSGLVIEINKFVAEWLREHIKKKDKRYCEFIKTGVCPAN